MKGLLKNEIILVVTVALGTLLNPLNSSMIAVALPRLQQEFALTFTDLSWLISTYYLASAIGQPVMGRLSDLIGRKRLFLGGLVLIAAASGLAPLSPNLGWLIGFRIIQAIGSSTLFPSGMGVIRDKIGHNQAQALGLLSIFATTSAAFGPSIGGLLLSVFDWPVIFLINFPFVIISFILALRILPKEARRTADKLDLDYGGMVFFSSMVVSLLFFLLSLSGGADWWLLLASIGLTALFYLHEHRQPLPFINVRTLKKNINANLVYLQFVLVNIVFYSLFFGIPTYLQTGRHIDAKTTGLIMLSLCAFSLLATPLAARIIDRRGPRTAMFIGAAGVVTGALLLLTIQPSTGIVWICSVLAILGTSSAFNNIGLQMALYSFVSYAETGAASGLFMTSRYIGTILSTSLLATIFGKAMSTDSFNMIAMVSTLIGLALVGLTLRMPNRRPLAGK